MGNPEQDARRQIDQLLVQAGWHVCDVDQANIMAHRGVAQRPLQKARATHYNPRIPIESFDIIATDECHRSIYNLWAQVLGTSTPT